MPKVNICVWHKPNGQIVAIGRAKTTKHKIVPIPGENQFVFQTDVEESQIETLHRTHIVDVNAKALVEHSSTQPKS